MAGRDFCRLHKYYFWMVVYFLSTCGLRIKWMAGNSLHQSSFILLTVLSMGTFIQLLSPCPTPTYRAEPDWRITGYFWDPRPVAPFNTTKLTSEGALRNQANSPGWAQSEWTVIQVRLWPWILRTVLICGHHPPTPSTVFPLGLKTDYHESSPVRHEIKFMFCTHASTCASL